MVHDWPVGGTNWRGSRQILQEGGGAWAEYWVPHAVQMGRGEGVGMDMGGGMGYWGCLVGGRGWVKK